MEKPVRTKAGVELDKFKRRLIRAVARLLLQEKKPEEEIWKELKKETGCDCELLWTRMRALTLKKLDRLLAADDCMDAVPRAARMSLTDWLLFDLVLVHQKIDLIGQNNAKDKEDRTVLVELFELVKMFKLESLSGEQLVNAWSLATLYYNKKGHHCSPMLLQRRWYQLKEVTRFKFYDFWYAYRGNLTRIEFAEPYRPSPLQTEIAKTFKLIVTEKFLDWDELIKQRLVSLPQEFERKMKERAAIRGPVSKPTDDVPDLVMIEPRIETIDLRLIPDDNEAEDNKQEGEEEVVLPPLVRIKQEPLDDIEVDETQLQPKKSLYEVVLERTALENEQLDSMDAAGYDPENDDVDMGTEETAREEEESVLPQIASVFGNVSDTSVLANIDEDRVYGSAENTVCSNVDDTCEDSVRGKDKDSADCDIVEDDIARGSEKESSASDNIDTNSSRNNDAVIEVSSDDKEADICDNVENVSENVGETSPDGSVSDEVNEISDDDEISGYVDANNDTGNAEETSITDNVQETNITGNVDEPNVFGNVICNVIETSVTGTVEVSGDIVKTNVTSEAEVVGTAVETSVSDIVEVIGNVNETSATANVEDNVVDPNVFGNVICNVIETSVTGTVEVSGDIVKTNVTSEAEVVGTAVETSVSDIVEVIGNVNETSATANVEDTTKLVAKENVPVLTVETTYPTIVAALKAPSNTVTNTAEVMKDIEIIETTSEPVVITDSDDDDYTVDDLVIYKPVPKSTEEEIAPKNNKDQPMELDSTSEDLQISSTEPLNGKKVIENAEDSAEKKVEMDIKPDVNSFTFGELSNDISFADEGIEFVDDGIVYVDEDCHTETKIKCEEKDKDEDIPKIDAKLLMCPVVYTTRLDDMGVFHAQINHIYINDKHLLDVITKKSKPIKKEPENTVENVTVNYCGENIESVTINDRKKTIEYVQKIDDENVLVKDSIIIKKEPDNVQSETIEDVPKIDDENVLVKDSIIIKKEPDNVQSETIEDVPKDNIVSFKDVPKENILNVEGKPENENNVISEDDEENVIDESQKVKPTSYLLQKPRSRKYHPIQLCKNPDFNTRLRRLSVGFFGSPRNRVLIKSCKPLTIDLSKAFESKLISGTLYLKPVDHNSVTEIIDDTRSHNVSVVPSAMPAQSLIDNSKVADILPMLQHCLEASKQPENVVPTSERNKVINLPDITEIRRINQRLLTAEVTPIQVQNNQPQVPVTIVTTPSNTSTYPAHKTTTIAETNTDLRSIVPEATDARGPPKVLEITDDPPAKKTSDYYTGRHHHGFRLPGRPPRMMNGKRLLPPKTLVWKPRQFRPEIPWLPKNYDANTNSKKTEETLLTLDALNKMLFLLTDKLEPEELAAKKPKPKPKRKINDQPPKQRGRPKSTQSDTHYMVLLRKAIEEEDQQLTSASEASSKCQMPKINIKAATNYPPDKDKTAGTEKLRKNIKYCCWARQRMLQLLFCRANIPLHGCREICQCCCSNLLRDYILHEQKTKNMELELVKEAPSLDRVSERALSPVQTSIQVPDVETVHVPDVETVQGSSAGMVPVPEDTQIIDVDATFTESTTNTTTQNEPIDIEAMDTEGDVPVPACEISVTTTGEVEKLAARGLEVPFNVTAKRRLVALPIVRNPNFISCAAPQIGKPGYRLTHRISSDDQSGGVILNAMKTPSTAVTPPISSPPTLEKFLAIKKSKTPSRFKTTMPLPPIINKPFVPPKNFKEKMIFLNSKQISEKPSKSPVFLGKNKILLTTIKFPPNLKLFEEAKKALRQTFKLPDGVRLVLLSDGTIVYKIDQNVAVNVTEVMEVPAIIAMVEEYMDKHAAQEEALQKQTGANESEVVDLIDDDDDDESAPNAHDNENNETPLGTEVQTTEETAAINSNDFLYVSHNSQMNTSNETEENCTDLNINSDVTETESNQNESADQYTVTEIQKDVQESIQSERLSVSTEQVQNQSDPTRQTVSAEIDDQPQPSSLAESTDVHEVSSEPAQNQSDPKSQTVSAEKDDQFKPPSQTEPTDVHEVSSEQAQNQLDLTTQTVSAERDDQPQPSNQTGNTHVDGGSSEQAQNQADTTTQTVSAETDDQFKPSSQTEPTDVREVSSEQAQNQFKPSSQNISNEVKDHLETAAPEESTSEPSRPKTKNILSDLMEMSGIFDEDMTSEIEETQPVGTHAAQAAEQIVLGPASLVAALPAPQVEEPPAPVCAGTSLERPILMSANFNRDSPLAPKLRSPLGDLTPITSLYELKYACANKGVFFKLDFETGYLVPINVCMKPTVMKPMQPPAGTTPRAIAPKSVIDLTEDDDKPEQNDTEPDTSPSKRSLLIVNNSRTDTFSGPVKPVKMFKALKPSILQRLNQNKIHLDGKDPSCRSSLDHKRKRKQFLRKINLNADSDAAFDDVQPNCPVPIRRYVKRKKGKLNYIISYKVPEEGDEPTPSTSRAEPYKEFATTILSNDDSSDDEPLAKIAKRKHENLTASEEDKNPPESGTKYIELELPAADVQPEAPVENQYESELPAPGVDQVCMSVDDNDVGEPQAPVEKQTELELPADGIETVYMSDDYNDSIELQTPFGFESNEEDEDCILGV